MKILLKPYESLFEGKFTPYVDSLTEETFFECTVCGERPITEERNDEGLVTQTYLTHSCHTGNYSFASAFLLEMQDYAREYNFI